MTVDVCVLFSNQWILMVLIGKTFGGGGVYKTQKFISHTSEAWKV